MEWVKDIDENKVFMLECVAVPMKYINERMDVLVVGL